MKNPPKALMLVNIHQPSLLALNSPPHLINHPTHASGLINKQQLSAMHVADGRSTASWLAVKADSFRCAVLLQAHIALLDRAGRRWADDAPAAAGGRRMRRHCRYALQPIDLTAHPESFALHCVFALQKSHSFCSPKPNVPVLLAYLSGKALAWLLLSQQA